MVYQGSFKSFLREPLFKRSLNYVYLVNPFYATCFQAKSVAQRFQEIVALMFGTPLNPREYWFAGSEQKMMNFIVV